MANIKIYNFSFEERAGYQERKDVYDKLSIEEKIQWIRWQTEKAMQKYGMTPK